LIEVFSTLVPFKLDIVGIPIGKWSVRVEREVIAYGRRRNCAERGLYPVSVLVLQPGLPDIGQENGTLMRKSGPLLVLQSETFKYG
jgi:hypothetical protein